MASKICSQRLFVCCSSLGRDCDGGRVVVENKENKRRDN